MKRCVIYLYDFTSYNTLYIRTVIILNRSIKHEYLTTFTDESSTFNQSI